MKIVHLSTFGPFDVFLHGQVKRAWSDLVAVRIEWSSRGKSRAERMRKAPLDTICRGLEWRLFYKRRTERTEREIEELLFGGQVPACEAALVLSSGELKTPQGVEQIRKLEGDLILVSNAPLLSPAVFELPPLGTVNVHRGITPAYRGEHTLFWPLYYRDFSQVGVTLHYINAGIDAGAMLAQATLPLAPGDTEGTLAAKAARAATELVCDFLPHAHRRPPGQQPTSEGRIWRLKERRIWHDLSLGLRRRWFGGALPTTEGKSSRFY